MNDDNTITVGKYLPVEQIEGGPLRAWDDFDHFQIIKYKWTKNGEIKLSEEIIKNDSFKNFSEKIKSYFLD